MDFNQYVQSLGYDPTTLTHAQTAALQTAWRDANRRAETSLPVADEIVSETAVATMVARAKAESPGRARELDSVGRMALAEGWTAQQLSLRLLQMSRPTGPHTSVPTSRGGSDTDAIEAGLMLSWGVPESAVAARHDDRTMQTARDRGYHRWGLHALFREQLSQAGHHVGSGRLGESDIKHALRMDAAASLDGYASGWSTIHTTGILSNAANKASLSAFEQTPTTWQLFCKRMPVANFKDHTAYRLTGELEFEVVPRGGSIPHGTLGEDEVTVAADTKGKMLTLDRRDIINDDLSLFSTIPTALGRAGAVGVDKAAHKTLLGGIGTFFAVGNGNYTVDHANAVLDLVGLAHAESLFLGLLDSDGNPAMIRPAVLLVAPKQGPAARSLVASQSLVGTAAAPSPGGNPFAGMFTPAVSPWLAASVGLPGAIDTGWFLLAGAGDFAPLVAGFLDGKETPTVESKEVDFSSLGMSWRGYFDWGLELFETRGGTYSNGEGS